MVLQKLCITEEELRRLIGGVHRCRPVVDEDGVKKPCPLARREAEIVAVRANIADIRTHRTILDLLCRD